MATTAQKRRPSFTRMNRMTRDLLRGLYTARRNDASIVVKAEDGRMVAQVQIRPAKGVRLNLKNSLPRTAPADVKRAFKDTKGGLWSQYMILEDEADLPIAREAISIAREQMLNTPRGTARVPLSTPA